MDTPAIRDRERGCNDQREDDSSFRRACREADARKARGELPRYVEPSPWREPPDHIPRYWDGMSLDALCARLDRARHFDGAPRTTLEALVLELRTHGIAALNPSCLRRLDNVSTAQLRDVLARLITLRPKYPVITDDLLLKIGGLL
jgi:hypothetical protein